MTFVIPEPETYVEIDGQEGKLHCFRNFQLVDKVITSFDTRIAADVATARRSHATQVEVVRERFRGVEPIDAMMEVIEDWTEGADVDESGRYLERYGRFITILAIPGNYAGVAGSPGAPPQRTEPLHVPEDGVIRIPS